MSESIRNAACGIQSSIDAIQKLTTSMSNLYIITAAARGLIVDVGGYGGSKCTHLFYCGIIRPYPSGVSTLTKKTLCLLT